MAREAGDLRRDYVPYTNGWSADFNPTRLLDAWKPWVAAGGGRRLVLGVPLPENGYAGQVSPEAAGAFDGYFRGLGLALVATAWPPPSSASLRGQQSGHRPVAGHE